MNYLAHLLLSENSPESRLGNLLGDFVKTDALAPFPLPIQRGVLLHQKIDSFTDTHAIFQQSRQRISLERRRFAGILIDIFYDHFLAVHWSTYAGVPLDEFAQSVYATLIQYQDILPDTLQQIAPHMIQHNWLVSYGSISGIQSALERVAKRLKRTNDLASAVTELETHYQQLEEDFLSFFPELADFVHQQIHDAPAAFS